VVEFVLQPEVDRCGEEPSAPLGVQVVCQVVAVAAPGHLVEGDLVSGGVQGADEPAVVE
jgi:hypothetical protein